MVWGPIVPLGRTARSPGPDQRAKKSRHEKGRPARQSMTALCTVCVQTALVLWELESTVGGGGGLYGTAGANRGW